jgi:hypothetical protein
VDLSDRPSHLIGSCLKLYFRQVCLCVCTDVHMAWVAQRKVPGGP